MLMQHLFLYFLPLNTCIQLLHSLDYHFYNHVIVPGDRIA